MQVTRQQVLPYSSCFNQAQGSMGRSQLSKLFGRSRTWEASGRFRRSSLRGSLRHMAPLRHMTPMPPSRRELLRGRAGLPQARIRAPASGADTLYM